MEPEPQRVRNEGSRTGDNEPIAWGDERGRLVRFCARMTGSADAAEDLAQETLLIALERRDHLRNPQARRAWLTGIARNVCLRWQRQTSKERVRHWEFSHTAPVPESSLETIADTTHPDVTELMERAEVGRLLEKALGQLPQPAHGLLIDRYIHDLPLGEIAARRGVREETAAVQLHRGRVALRRLLTTDEMRDEAIALGLLRPEECSSLQETRLWCPSCGTRRLQGFFGRREKDHLQFLLVCPACQETQGEFVAMSYTPMLEGIKGFKPALNRINRWWWEKTQEHLTNPAPACTKCGSHTVRVMTLAPETFRFPLFRDRTGVFVQCERCHFTSAIESNQLSMNTPEAQRFWQENPRMRTLPEQSVSTPDGELLVTRMESVTSAAAIEVALHRATMRVIHVKHT